jgi:hypothetical protein
LDTVERQGFRGWFRDADVYAPDVTPRDILLTRKVPPPPEAKPLLTALVQVSRAEGQPAGGIREGE